MEEINIVHYYHSSCIPLKSITEFSKKEAFEIARKIGKNDGESFYRFKDFVNYYPRRIKTEKWLYNWFINNGGEPKTEHPLYFVLEGSNFFYNWFDKGKIIKIPLSEIDSKHICFTIGDSCSKYNKNDIKDPILKRDLYKLIEQFNGNINEMLNKVYEENNIKYIECQLWDNRYIQKVKNKFLRTDDCFRKLYSLFL